MHVHMPVFNALVSSAETLKLNLQRIGLDNVPTRVTVGRDVGERLEYELQCMPPEIWETVIDGIHVYAEGDLKQVALFETILICWKTGDAIRNRRNRNDITHKAHKPAGKFDDRDA